MKRFELYIGIVMLIVTTMMDILFPFVVPYSSSNLALIMLLSVVGYIVGYLFIDSYVCKLETHCYVKGYNDGLEDAHLHKEIN